ncbi:MAG: prephenate dehydrogenase/arogenate dehydrogenase family protein [Betaproteobacteria bacterium]|nr:MAG: prephenate dehydrogenase/arogenate dehydrogenase family protein [Betaproteobacteria bacterium]
MIKRLAILGVGLIGGSFALALRRAGVVETVVGYGRSAANLATAQRMGILDAVATTAALAVQGADLVCIAAPVGAVPGLLAEAAPALRDDAILVDVGSTKQGVIAAARVTLETHTHTRIAQFVPCHPIAGAEDSGAAAARAELFHGRAVIITPLPENAPATLARVTALWQACGARVTEMEAVHHDHIFAAVSHLPHLAAFALVAELASRPEAETFFLHAGSGFRDFTRIAASHPEMWRDIALANRDALLTELDAYQAQLATLRTLLATNDRERLSELFARASHARRSLTLTLDKS